MILKGIFWNFIGLILPAAIAFPIFGIMARTLNVEDFGIFMILFSIVGFSSFFDLGLSRAVVRHIAKAEDDFKKKKEIIATSGIVVFVMGVIAAVILIFSSNFFIEILNISKENYADALLSWKLLAISMPFILTSLVFASIPEGELRFFELNLYKAISGVIIILLPMMFIFFDASLYHASLGLLLSRCLVFLMSFYFVKNYGKLFDCFNFVTLKELFNFGGWITISNIVGPLMVYGDRFFLSHLMGAHKVAYYTLPSEFISRMSVLPTAVTKTLFPIISKRENKFDNSDGVYGFWLGVVLILIAAPCFIFSELILEIWLGKDFSENSTGVFRILLIGFLFNAFAQLTFSKIQAMGHSKLIAIVHLCELLPYLIVFYFLVKEWGILGAAFAWGMRCFVDCVIFKILLKTIYSKH